MGEVFEGDGGMGEGTGRDRHQDHRVVIACDAVVFQVAAGFAAVNEDPLVAIAEANGDGFHAAVAIGLAVAGEVIDVLAPEAEGAVVAVLGAEGELIDLLFAVDAAEGAA